MLTVVSMIFSCLPSMLTLLQQISGSIGIYRKYKLHHGFALNLVFVVCILEPKKKKKEEKRKKKKEKEKRKKTKKERKRKKKKKKKKRKKECMRLKLKKKS